MTARIAFLLASALALAAQNQLPRFEDLPAPTDWKGPAAVPNITNRYERMFRTRVLQASREPANFAGHYRFEIWGCGSNCASGVVVDLATGQVIAPPLSKTGELLACPSSFEGSGVDVRLDSRLMVVRCGLNFDEQLQRNVPDVYYFALEDDRFRELAHLHGKAARVALK
jgi:hypothetical protein